MKRKVLTLYLDTWYGSGHGISSDRMLFGNGLFASLGLEEVHVPLESFDGTLPSGNYAFAFIVPYEKVHDLRPAGCPVVAWMCDDVWRYETFGRLWAEVSDLIVTTDPASALLYGDKGILSNWAARVEWQRHLPLTPPELSVGFQGQMYGRRRDLLFAIEQALLSDPDCPIRLLANNTGEELLSEADYFEGLGASAFSLCLTESSHGTRQMKSRLFEPQLFDSILVTEPVPGLERYWDPGRECVVFHSPEDCAEQIRWICRSNAERTAMAERARRRLLAEHTYQHRFAPILERLGVSVG